MSKKINQLCHFYCSQLKIFNLEDSKLINFQLKILKIKLFKKKNVNWQIFCYTHLIFKNIEYESLNLKNFPIEIYKIELHIATKVQNYNISNYIDFK